MFTLFHSCHKSARHNNEEREREQQEHVDRLQCCASRTHGFNIGSSGAAACRSSEVESPESIYEKYVTGKVLGSSLGRMGRAANYTTDIEVRGGDLFPSFS